MLAILDGTVLPAAEARIPATDEGLLRGDGVFEVIALFGGRPFALDEHLERLERSARNLRLPLDLAVVRADLEALLAANREPSASLRYLVTRGGHRLGLIEPVLPAPPGAVTLATVTYAPTRILDDVKSLSYAANMLATRIAHEQEADDALLVTPHGRLLELPTATFALALPADDVLVTPPLSDHVLDSITRRRLLALGQLRERVLARDDLALAAEACIISTTRTIQAVRQVDEVVLPVAPGPLTTEAAARLRAQIQQELGVTAL